MGGISGSKETSKPVFHQFPGVFGTPDSARIAGNLEQLLGSGISSSPFRQPLVQSILNPEFGPTTASEEALLDTISQRTQGASALRGLGPSTPGALAQNLAPALIGLRQQRIGNLSGALGQDIGIRGQDIQGLIELAGLAMPQIVGGQKSKGNGGGLAVSGKAPGLGK